MGTGGLEFWCYTECNRDVPHTLKSLLEDHTSEAVSFRNNIGEYNIALTFTSLGANFDQSLLDGSGPYVLKLYGELYHNHGALIPNENRDASYAQLYIYDSQMTLNQRMNRNQSLDRDTMSHLQDMLLEHNTFVPLYRQAAERLRDQGVSLDVQVRLTYHPPSDPRRYNVLWKIPEILSISIISQNTKSFSDSPNIIQKSQEYSPSILTPFSFDLATHTRSYYHHNNCQSTCYTLVYARHRIIF